MTTELLTVIEPDGSINGHEPGLSDEELVHCYRTMLAVRAFDDTCMKLQRAGRIGFSIPNRGIEATQVGAASALRKSDWLFPSYRDFGMALYHGITPLEMMNNMYGNAEDTSKGRQMPVHFSFRPPEQTIRFVSISSPIGTHLPQAVGAAYAIKLRGEDDAVLVSFGDGGTSSLGFHSAMNFAGVWKAPVVFLCQNNGWAISCPAEQQTASETFAIKGLAYGVPGVIVDGNDLLAVRKGVLEALERARSGGGPTLIESVSLRWKGHAGHDPAKYVPTELLEEYMRDKDPVKNFERRLLAEHVVTEQDVADIQSRIEKEFEEGYEFALASPFPEPEDHAKGLWVEDGYWTSEPGRGGGTEAS
jgi:2-oxoisovalerate dehydrogenase E1 component alpha subunit